MRRSLLVTAAAAISMVLLAMLVPMAILVRSYALEDRLARAALEVQAVETVVSGQDEGVVGQYVDRINDGTATRRSPCSTPTATGIGPDPGEDAKVLDARNTGRARVDDVAGGSQILVPVSRGGNSALPSATPVIRVVVDEPGLDSVVGRRLGPAGGARARPARRLAGGRRPARSLVRAADPAARRAHPDPRPPRRRRPARGVDGPPEVQELAGAVDRLVGRIQLLLARERENVADLSHRLRTPVTALRLRVEARRRRRPARPARPRPRPAPGDRRRDRPRGPALRARGPRPADRRGRGARRARRHWEPLAEDQGRAYEMDLATSGPLLRASRADLEALVDVLLDNVFSHTPDDAGVRITLDGPDDRVDLVVDDAGPGLPAGPRRRPAAARAAPARPAWASRSPRAPPRTRAAR